MAMSSGYIPRGFHIEAERRRRVRHAHELRRLAFVAWRLMLLVFFLWLCWHVGGWLWTGFAADVATIGNALAHCGPRACG